MSTATPVRAEEACVNDVYIFDENEMIVDLNGQCYSFTRDTAQDLIILLASGLRKLEVLEEFRST